MRIATIVGTLAAANAANAAERVDWATGADFQRRLAEPCNILWAANPLRQALTSLAHARKTAILIDRRVDPSQKLDVSLEGVPLESAIQQIAKDRGLEATHLGSVIYIGPPRSAEHLRAIAASLDRSIGRLSAAAKRKFRQSQALAWDDLATPRELLKGLADDNGLQIKGLDRVPHDLWAAANLPPLTLADRLSLIAVQFDLEVKIANRGEQIELVALTGSSRSQPQIERPSPASRPASNRRAAVKPEPPASLDQKRIDRLVVQNKPLGPVLKALAARLDFELKIDETSIRAANISLDQLVSVHAENATIDNLLEQVLRSTGLTFHRQGRIVEIVPTK